MDANHNDVTRRGFLGAAAGALTLAQAAETAGMPVRPLGRTGAKVSALIFGCGSRFLAYQDEAAAQQAIETALAQGINYFDTAYGYGDGRSEERVGRFLAGKRNQVFIATKIQARNGDEAMRVFEGSLKRLKTDHVDLLHMHSLSDEDDLKAIEAKGGVLERFYQLREQKVARALGVTCHSYPEVLKTCLERHDLDCTQMALNAARIGQVAPRSQAEAASISFEATALPVAIRKKMGVTAMKIFAQDKLVGKMPSATLIRYSLSLPVAGTVIGMPKLDHIRENAAIVKGFTPLSREERERIAGILSPEHKAGIDAFFADHADA